jgi:hypothetical protein
MHTREERITQTSTENYTMDEAIVKLLQELGDALRGDISTALAEHTKKMDAKHEALADSVAKMKKRADDEAGERDRGVDKSMRRDNDDEDGNSDKTAARRVAADAVGAAEFSVLCSQVADLRKAVARPQADLGAFADAQAKADAVMRTHNEWASPPMAGEDIVSYNIRLARPMQRHSPRWKGVELRAIAADSVALENILTEIRADATKAGLEPVGLKEFEHRMIQETLPGGHISRRWVGTGTIFKQMSRPVRHVAYIGVRK